MIHLNAFIRSSLKAIEKAIVNSDLGVTPSNDGDVIRLSLPPLTSDRRKVPLPGKAYYMTFSLVNFQGLVTVQCAFSMLPNVLIVPLQELAKVVAKQSEEGKVGRVCLS